MIVEEATRAGTGAREPAADAPPRPGSRRATPVPLALVLASLPLVALAELVLTRTFYRVGIFIPKEGHFRTVYAALTAVGSFAFNLATVLAFLGLALLAVRAWRAQRRSVAVALGAFGGAALLAALPGEAGPTVRLLFVLAAVVVAWPFVRRPGPWAERLAVGAITAAILLSAYAGLVGDADRLVPSASGPGGGVGAHLAGEAAVVVAAFLMLAAWMRDRGPRVGPLLAGLLPAAAFLVAWQANGAVTGILVLWTAGLRLYLPLGLYVAALWAFSSAAVGWAGPRPWRAAGMALLVAAGFLLDSTYGQLLAVIALVLLTDGMTVGGLPAARRGDGIRVAR